jgi:hypothetical protein
MSELRKQIAEVLGYKIIWSNQRSGWILYHHHPNEFELAPKELPANAGDIDTAWEVYSQFVPRWDTDLNAAWQLLEHVAKEHEAHDISLRWSYKDTKPSCCIMNSKLDIRVRAFGETPALAICKAFLAFMERVGEASPST